MLARGIGLAEVIFDKIRVGEVSVAASEYNMIRGNRS